MDYNTIIVLSGTALLGASAGLAGSFAVLRRGALAGDALAHAALPGVCVAFLLAGGKNLPFLLLGALGSGLLGIAVIAGLSRWTRIKQDAAIGVVLSGFFGAGLGLSQWIQANWSDGSKAGLDSFIFGKTAGMIAADVMVIGLAALTCLVAILLFYKEFQAVAFDPNFSKSQGMPSTLLDFAMMALTAITVAIGLPAVGVLLMAALLILPAASARFWSDRLSGVLILSAMFGSIVGSSGAFISSETSLPAGPVIVLVGTLVFLASFAISPKRGLIARLFRLIELRNESRYREFLRLACEIHERRGSLMTDPIALSEWLPLKSWTMDELRNLAKGSSDQDFTRLVDDNRVTLTQKGVEQALNNTRIHRLWKEFLAKHPDDSVQITDLNADPAKLLPASEIASLEASLRSKNIWPASMSKAYTPGQNGKSPISDYSAQREVRV